MLRLVLKSPLRALLADKLLDTANLALAALGALTATNVE
jgi:hypothetical protein